MEVADVKKVMAEPTTKVVEIRKRRATKEALKALAEFKRTGSREGFKEREERHREKMKKAQEDHAQPQSKTTRKEVEAVREVWGKYSR